MSLPGMKFRFRKDQFWLRGWKLGYWTDNMNKKLDSQNEYKRSNYRATINTSNRLTPVEKLNEMNNEWK